MTTSSPVMIPSSVALTGRADERLEAALEATLEDRRGARRWLAIAVTSLILAGALALFLVIGRVPPLDGLFDDPLLFKRALVVHVVLALVVWFFAYVGGLFRLVPSARRPTLATRLGHALAVAGLVAIVAAAAWPGATPVLSNYVPMIDHPLFSLGVVAFGLGLVLSFLDHRLATTSESSPHLDRALIPPAARPGLRAAAVAVLVAALTFFASYLTTPRTLPPEPYFEALVWGGGHVLQFASSAAMCAVWLTLLTRALGVSPVSRKAAAIAFGLLVAPLMAAPLMADTQLPGSRAFFTRLMELAIFPAVSFFLVASVVAIVRRARHDRTILRDRRVLGFFASAALTLLGFGLGAAIDGSNTMIPAHYHASIGAVTAAFMTLTYELFAPLGLGAPGPRTRAISHWQPLAFGFGQLVFALGFAIAGAHGLARKTYGSEQVADATGHTLGLVVMGVGGLVAVAAGLTYLAACTSAWRRRERTGPSPLAPSPEPPSPHATPSRSAR